MIFGNKILDYWDDILRDLGTLVAIPSVCGTADGMYPYGKEPARALDTALALARSYGLETQNVDYYAGHAQYGEGDENAIVMAHLDVVPAGEGWDTDPFQMVEKDGLLFGRGVSDNKGPAVIALHCLRALKEAGTVSYTHLSNFIAPMISVIEGQHHIQQHKLRIKRGKFTDHISKVLHSPGLVSPCCNSFLYR